MPTAVERLLFLKLAQFDDFADFIGAHEHKLNDALSNIDGDFLKLSTATGDNFLKIEGNPELKHDFHVIGDSFLKVGDAFEDVALPAVQLKIAPSAQEGVGESISLTFGKLETAMNVSGQDLKILASDFLKLDTSTSAENFQLKIRGLGEDFLTLNGDMAADGAAAHKLADDFFKLAGGGDNPSPLDLAYKELGGDLQMVGDRFDALATDFLKVDEALGGRESDFGGSVGTALMSLNNDFIKLHTAFDAVGDTAFKIFVGDLSSFKVTVG